MGLDCKSGEIPRDGHCKALPGKVFTTAGSLCNENARGDKRTMSSCGRGNFKKACTWVEGKCITDQGKPGQTPPGKRFIPKFFKGEPLSPFMPAGKMPFNKKINTIFSNCQSAGNGMQKKGIKAGTAKKKVLLAYNVNSRLRKPDAATWGNQRTACLEGIESAYKK